MLEQCNLKIAECLVTQVFPYCEDFAILSVQWFKLHYSKNVR